MKGASVLQSSWFILSSNQFLLCPQDRGDFCFLVQASFKEFLPPQSSLFFETNDSPLVRNFEGVMWANYSTVKKAEKWSCGQIYNLYSSAPSPLLYREHLQLQSKWDLSSKSKTHKQLFLAKRYFFETGDNVGRLLACFGTQIRSHYFRSWCDE